MWNYLIDGYYLVLPACSTRCAERITFASLEDTCLYFRCCCQRACVTFVGSGCPRPGLQAVGIAGNPGRRSTQAAGHVCKRSTDSNYGTIDIPRQDWAKMGAERFRLVGSSREPRLEKRANGVDLVWPVNRAAWAR